MTSNEKTSSGSPELAPSSDTDTEFAETADDAVSPGSTATGDPTSLGQRDLPQGEEQVVHHNPSRLIQGNRVTTPHDME